MYFSIYKNYTRKGLLSINPAPKINYLPLVWDEGWPWAIERITKVISNDLNLNIRSFSIEGEEGYFEGRMSLLVKNKVQVDKVIHTLGKLSAIASVERIE